MNRRTALTGAAAVATAMIGPISARAQTSSADAAATRALIARQPCPRTARADSRRRWGVGSFAVQLAVWRRAYVIATAAAHNSDFVRELGAHQVIGYSAARFEEEVDDVDVVLDPVGGETLQGSKSVLKPNGRLISVATDSKTMNYIFYVEANHAQLIEIARLIDGGQIRPIMDGVFPLDLAGEAYERKPKRGKTVLQVEAQTSQ